MTRHTLRTPNKLMFVIEKTGIDFSQDGKFWTYDGKWFDPKKVYEKVMERIEKGRATKVPEDREDRNYYIKSFGPMC